MAEVSRARQAQAAKPSANMVTGMAHVGYNAAALKAGKRLSKTAAAAAPGRPMSGATRRYMARVASAAKTGQSSAAPSALAPAHRVPRATPTAVAPGPSK